MYIAKSYIQTIQTLSWQVANLLVEHTVAGVNVPLYILYVAMYMR